jgi:hypothetical protein
MRFNKNQKIRGNGLINPEHLQKNKKKNAKKIPNQQDGLMEREEHKIITEDGRELLK